MFLLILIVEVGEDDDDDDNDGEEDRDEDDECFEPFKTCWSLWPTGRDEITFVDGLEGGDIEP